MKSVTKFRLFWINLHRWVREHRLVTWVICISLVLIVAGAVSAYFLINQPDGVAKAPATKPIETPKPKPKYYSPLTGLLVRAEANTTSPVTCLMIENSPNARPQSGLKDSGVVFEAIAEGGITRFLVIYQQEKPQLIGPVRSLRLYDVDWAAAFDCSIGHVGGSAMALREVRNGDYRDIDQFFNPGSYWRANDRYSPHNVYTSFKQLDKLNRAKGYKTSQPKSFSRTDGVPNKKPSVTNITITISSFLYNSTYAYNKKANAYARYQGGAKHLDRELGQITPNVIIAMRVNETAVFEDGWREQITTVGKGEAYIFQNGKVINATWRKPSKSSQLTFTDKDKKDIKLVRGQTWIVAVPTDGGDVSWQ